MSEIFDLETEQTLLCDDCSHVIPSGLVWFCPNCLANLCDTCRDDHCCSS